MSNKTQGRSPRRTMTSLNQENIERTRKIGQSLKKSVDLGRKEKTTRGTRHKDRLDIGLNQSCSS